MTFKHKLACRLALLKDRFAAAAAAVVVAVAVFSCEKPVSTTGPVSSVTSVVVSPPSVTLQPNQDQDFTAVAFTAAGDTAQTSVSWAVTGGAITDMGASNGRHYGRYHSNPCGTFTVTATSKPDGNAGSASVSVPCAIPVASVSVSPASASVQVGNTVQLTAAPKDANGNPLSGRTVTWSSSNPSVATVDGTGLVTSVVAGSATITATSEGQSGTASVTVSSVPVASVAVSPATASLSVGQTAQLTATPKDANGNPLIGRAVTWSTTNGSVATVSATGLVTAAGAGSATITATSEGKSGTASVTVTPVTGQFAIGDSVQTTVAAWVRNTSQPPADPATGTPPSVIGTQPAGVRGVVDSGPVLNTTPGGDGAIRYHVLFASGVSGWVVQGNLAKIVPTVPVASVTVSPATASLTVGQTVQLTATPKDANGNALTGRTITWSSSDNTIATVNGSGVVTGVGSGGPVTITATSEGQSGTATVNVTLAPVASVTVAPSSASIAITGTAQLTATPKDASGNPLTGRAISWSSSDNTIATVNGSGLVTGVAVGSVTITATSEGQSGTATVTVVHVAVASVTVSPATASVQVGSTIQLTATPKDASGNPLSGRVVTWASSNTAMATVSSSGLVTGVAAGSATITAASEGQGGTSAITVTVASSGSQFGHVFIVTEENTNYSNVIGSSSMLDLKGLAQQYGLATQYYGNTHPSIGNYFELATGQILTNNDGSSTIENVPNVVRSLVAAGKTWKSYAESIPNACYLGGDTGNYARKHNVFALLSDVANDPTGQACNIVPFTQFATDMTNGALPTFSNIVPNLCTDAHDCGLSTAATWLKNNIDPLIKSATFQQDGLLIIVFDESGGDNTNGGGRVVWVAGSPKSKPAYQSTTLYQHQSTLRLILKGLGVTVFPGAAASAPDMSEFFTP